MLAVALHATLLAGASSCSARWRANAPPAAARSFAKFDPSFYRKLLLAFVAGAVVPVVILAIAIRTYFATQLLDGAAEAAAARP